MHAGDAMIAVVYYGRGLQIVHNDNGFVPDSLLLFLFLSLSSEDIFSIDTISSSQCSMQPVKQIHVEPKVAVEVSAVEDGRRGGRDWR